MTPSIEGVSYQTHNHLLLVSFCYPGPGNTYQELVNRLARTVATAPGIIWKTWFLNEDERVAGSLHLFYDAEALEQYARSPALAWLAGDTTIADPTVQRFCTLNEIPLIAIRHWESRERRKSHR